MNFMLERQNSLDKTSLQQTARAQRIHIVVSVARNWLHYVNPQGRVVNRLFPSEDDLWEFMEAMNVQAFVPKMNPLFLEISEYAKQLDRAVFVARNTQFLCWVHYVTATGVHRTRCFPSVEEQDMFIDSLIKFEPDIPGS